MLAESLLADLSSPANPTTTTLAPTGDQTSKVISTEVVARRGIVRTIAGASISAVIRTWQFFCLVILLAIAASIPIFQFASLGYLLESSGRWARGERLRRCLPGLKLAGYIGTAAVWIGLTSIPVAVVRDMAASAELVNPGSTIARNWQIGSAALWIAWVVYVWWAILRGGRVYHFLWPAPIRFFREFFRLNTWSNATDRLANGIQQFRIFSLLKFGLIGTLGTLIYLAVPGSLMIAGIRAQNDGVKGLLTIAGVIVMAIMLQYLPFLQMRYAQSKRFRSFFELKTVREGFKRAPWLHAISVLLLVVFSLPLYLLRIEMPPAQFVWLLCVFFVLFNIPTKFMLAWAIRYADQRERRRAWYSRWPAWMLLIAGIPFYIFFLYIASLASWDGSAVMIMQHAFLTPVPFLLN